MANMSGAFLVFTLLLTALPVVLVVPFFRTGDSRALIPALIVVAGFAWVYLWMRPREFVVSKDDLTLQFPLRKRVFARSEIERVRILESSRTIKEEFGWLARIGVGGFLGTFGMLWGPRRGGIDTYVTRMDGFVLVERRGGRPLLINPSDPEQFVDTLTPFPLDKADHL